MAFHPYPQLIPRIFNFGGFGPPFRVTGTSTWPWVDHLVSGLHRTTERPVRTRFRCGSTSTGLTLLHSTTRRLIMQKARRHPCMHRAPTACRLTVSGSLSLPSQGCFSPFPHGTGSLSVAREYLALRDGPRRFLRGSTCPGVLGCHQSSCAFRVRGYHPLWPDFPDRSATHASPLVMVPRPRTDRSQCGLGCSRFAHRYLGNRFFFLFLRVLRCFSSPRSPPHAYVFSMG